MKLVDLTHPFSIHTPGWVGYPSPKLSYFQRHATHGIVCQLLELPLHCGTHFDGEFHIVSGGKDIASIPLDTLCREGVIVDISDEMEDWTVIKPKHITDRVEVKKGDILLYHTGYHRYYNGGAGGGRGALLPAPSRRRPRVRRVDRRDGARLDRLRLRLRRPSDEHLDPPQAAGRPRSRTRSRSARTSTRSSPRRTCSSCTGSRSRTGSPTWRTWAATSSRR